MVDLRQLLTRPKPTVAVRLLRWLLRAASLPYGAVMGLRNWGYDQAWLQTTRAALPVISVGNLSVGGTGKSPMVAWLAGYLRQRGVRVAVLSRGYGQLDSGQNDEALELELALPDVPHLQHWDRIASARLAAEELDMQLLLLDDGFQHRRLGRDLEIVLVDASESAAGRWLLPGGLLREPMSSLSRADVVVLTRTARADIAAYNKLLRQVQRRAPQAAVVSANHRPTSLWSAERGAVEFDQLSQQSVLAFCAIGSPGSFFGSLTELGANVLDTRTWPDHHAFSGADVAALAHWVEQFPSAQVIVCTMKDWVKIQSESIAGLPLLALRIEMEFTQGAAALTQRIDQLLESRSIHADAVDDM